MWQNDFYKVSLKNIIAFAFCEPNFFYIDSLTNYRNQRSIASLFAYLSGMHKMARIDKAHIWPQYF